MPRATAARATLPALLLFRRSARMARRLVGCLLERPHDPDDQGDDEQDSDDRPD
jgi:hypothetical protein